ncbi:hypothetical protein Fot_29328 [Forsythia ovata]|uniref:Uncharacterized protein n=1 Tax=Forsythia ovata TaxID=205694 RepID=A0ABD1TRM7_9LAMI
MEPYQMEWSISTSCDFGGWQRTATAGAPLMSYDVRPRLHSHAIAKLMGQDALADIARPSHFTFLHGIGFGWCHRAVMTLKIRCEGVVDDIPPPPSVPSATSTPGVTALQTPETMVGSSPLDSYLRQSHG